MLLVLGKLAEARFGSIGSPPLVARRVTVMSTFSTQMEVHRKLTSTLVIVPFTEGVKVCAA